MKICYIVYREDNVMVFDSQVLEYLQKLKEYPDVEETSLVLFRHEDNLFKKNEVENKVVTLKDMATGESSEINLDTFVNGFYSISMESQLKDLEINGEAFDFNSLFLGGQNND